ncbi:MAG: hypothetical protein M0R03_12490 [Novosphingobium sp.]|nr:hypothetical protein [Novosphingobium sp.]
MKTKICTKCKQEKSLYAFHFRKDTNRYRNNCSKCHNIQTSLYYSNNKEKCNFQSRKNYHEIYKLDKTCQEKKKKTTEKFNNLNPNYNKIYYEKNKQILGEMNKKYKIEHKKEYAQYFKEYRILNKKKIKRRLKNKYDSDINYKIKVLLRTRLNLALNGNFKKGKTLDLLGCSINKLKYHLESQFKEGMTWDNHSLHGWHIDHIKPCCRFDLSKESEQKKCFPLHKPTTFMG